MSGTYFYWSAVIFLVYSFSLLPFFASVHEYSIYSRFRIFLSFGSLLFYISEFLGSSILAKSAKSAPPIPLVPPPPESPKTQPPLPSWPKTSP
ncbi:hypothetical protein BJ165DRAFT_1512280 [Panaeolus papilionaceus]|nr:hypothetical protein BJ165DRAFT_1512280 [Panaeolus papilionaceus]